MSDAGGVGQMLGSAGTPAEIVVGKTKWLVGHPDQAAKARLEKLVAKAALDEVRRLKDVLDPGTYREAFAEAVATLKDYRTWRPGWQRIVFDPAYFHLYLWSLLQEHQPQASEDDVREICERAPEEVRAAVAEVMPGFFRMLLADLEGHAPEETLRQVAAGLDKTFAAMRERPTPTPATSST